MLTTFVVIAVCVNNVLVMFDTWFQTSNVGKDIFDKKMDRRMSYVLRRTVSGTFMTSCTTAVAILGNAWSPIMPVSSVAIYGGVFVICNFVMVLMVIPPTLIIYDEIETKCVQKVRNKEPDEDENLAQSLDE